MSTRELFLPVSREDLIERGWYWYDFLIMTGDAYVDHPSFGASVIGRVLENAGYRVAMLAQPNWKSTADLEAMGRPRLAALVGAGNLDSMVAHYTAAKKRRSEDAYSPAKKTGLRPDRAVTVYSNLVRRAFPGLPVIIGGLEASLRRFAHYDYWDDKVRRGILFDSAADLLVYGMAERAELEIAARLSKGEKIETIRDVRGTGFIADSAAECAFPYVECASYEKISADKRAYAEANMVQYNEHDFVTGKAVLQRCGTKTLIINPPAKPLNTQELDKFAELPYTREWHPMYDEMGGVPALEEVKFSIIHNRGCFGACNFCALAFHQGRFVTSRSHDSVVAEAVKITELPDFKGYIHDVGGPTANFRRPACKKQIRGGFCRNRACLAPFPCKNLDADHTDYLTLLRKLRAVPKVKKVFVRSGIRFDYLMQDKSGEFFAELVKHHISGQLKVAPEHCINSVLDYMGKPHIETYEKFMQKYERLNQKYDKKQFLVPYLISSHPGSTLQNAIALAEYLNKQGHMPEQVQDFYPTPGTISTCMYYTGIDPRTMKEIYVARTEKEKRMQRALLQWRKPNNRALVIEALRLAERDDLIGYGKGCLVRPDAPPKKPAADAKRPAPSKKSASAQKTQASGRGKSAGKAKPKTAQKPQKTKRK